jgi:hypothetical protein
MRTQSPLTRQDKIEGWAFGAILVIALPALLFATT